MGKLILETPRLSLREMTRHDLDFVASMLGDERVMQHYPKCYSRAEAEIWVDRIIGLYTEVGHSFWLTSLRDSGEPIGQVGLLRQHVDGVHELEIGYMIHASYWRQGYAHEAAAGVRDYAFGVLDKSRVISLIRPANVPSQRVALSIGMKPEKMTMFRDAESLVFSMSRDARDCSIA
jgi:ribosomal-protein-alanine N-acetyltransferase